MPRISPALIRQARQYHPLLPPLLGPCRTIESAANELRWLHEHAVAETGYRVGGKPDPRIPALLQKLVLERAKGVPLQYVTGNTPFGLVEILCRKGVFIPRPETESIVRTLCRIMRPKGVLPQHVKVLDLCTGTGCIPIFTYDFYKDEVKSLDILGVDISPQAVDLAKRNLTHYDKFNSGGQKSEDSIKFFKADIFKSDSFDPRAGQLDVLIANPPYISPRSFNVITENSVRKYEPNASLVPPARRAPQSDESVGDSFYPRLLEIAMQRKPTYVLLEVGDLDQGIRVMRMAMEQGIWAGGEIWRDLPEADPGTFTNIGFKDMKIRVRGEGNGRAVYLLSKSFKERQSPAE